MRTLVVVAALALGGCVSHDFSEGQRTYYRCGADRDFSLRRLDNAVEVFAAGQTHRLEAAGERQYSNGAATLNESRGRATLTGVSGGPYENCQRRRSDWWFDVW